MKREINDKANELGLKYFPNELNIWARENIEAIYCSGACIAMAEWMQKKMIEKACEWIIEHINIPYEGEYIDDSPVASDYIEWCDKRLEYAKAVADAFKQAMEE